MVNNIPGFYYGACSVICVAGALRHLVAMSGDEIGHTHGSHRHHTFVVYQTWMISLLPLLLLVLVLFVPSRFDAYIIQFCGCIVFM
jgi:hypothetical protein